MAVGCNTVCVTEERPTFVIDFSEWRTRGFKKRVNGRDRVCADGQTEWIEKLGGLMRCDRLRVARKKCRLIIATGVL